MSINIRAIWRINSNAGDAETAKQWASEVLMLLHDASNQITAIHDMREPFNAETFGLYMSQKATFRAIEDVTNEVKERKPDLDKKITDIDRWFK